MKTIDIALDSRTVTLWALGRRVERLLLGGIALIALTLLAFYLAFAARHYAENRASQSMESLALLIEGDDKVLQRFYELEVQRQKLVQKKKEAAPAENFYQKALEDKIVRAAALSGSDAASLRVLVDTSEPPAELVKSLRERKKALDDQPAAVAGMVVPSSSLATSLPAAFVANALIIGLAPLVILWLAGLWTTRRHEQNAMDDDIVPYPHALNAADLPLENLVYRYAGDRWPEQAVWRVRTALLAFQRVAIVGLLVVPVIAGYIASVVTLGAESDTSWLRTLYLGVVIAIMLFQAVGVMVTEAIDDR